jgi:tetratricopeptide (TPR) repeat protein
MNQFLAFVLYFILSALPVSEATASLLLQDGSGLNHHRRAVALYIQTMKDDPSRFKLEECVEMAKHCSSLLTQGKGQLNYSDYYNTALVYFHVGRWEEARRSYLNCVGAKDCPAIWDSAMFANAGYASAKLGNKENASEDFQSFIRLHQDRPAKFLPDTLNIMEQIFKETRADGACIEWVQRRRAQSSQM